MPLSNSELTEQEIQTLSQSFQKEIKEVQETNQENVKL